jgi:hypothetical protein
MKAKLVVAKSSKKNCLPVTMTVVDTLITKKSYRGALIPDTKEIEAVRVLNPEAWLEHNLLSKDNFYVVPLSRDQDIALSQAKGIPLYRHAKAGMPYLLIMAFF